jgi:hypothetical protein
MDKEELLVELATQNVVNVQNISITKNGGKQKTNTIIVTFAQATPPTKIEAGHLKIPVQQYYPSPLRCFKCQKFGHYKSVCKRAAICAQCGHAEHDASPCAGPLKCVNCSGNHSAFDKSCPKWIKETEIIKVKTNANVSFPEARKLVEAKNNQPRPGFSFAAAVGAASTKSALTRTDASTQTDIIRCTCQSSPRQIDRAVATEPLVASRCMETENDYPNRDSSPEQPRSRENMQRKSQQAANKAAKHDETIAETKQQQQLPKLQGSPPTLAPRSVELNAKGKFQNGPSANEKSIGSIRALDCFEDSPQDFCILPCELSGHVYS